MLGQHWPTSIKIVGPPLASAVGTTSFCSLGLGWTNVGCQRQQPTMALCWPNHCQRWLWAGPTIVVQKPRLALCWPKWSSYDKRWLIVGPTAHFRLWSVGITLCQHWTNFTHCWILAARKQLWFALFICLCARILQRPLQAPLTRDIGLMCSTLLLWKQSFPHTLHSRVPFFFFFDYLRHLRTL